MSTVLKGNIESWSYEQPETAPRIATAEPDQAIRWEQSRSGMPVPVVAVAESRFAWVHSRYDPVREAQHLEHRTAACDLIVFMGVGAGYHASAFYHNRPSVAILIVEPDRSALRSTLEHVDLSSLLASPRVRIAMGGNQVAELVPQLYQPVLGNSFIVHVTPHWTNRPDTRQQYMEAQASVERCAFELRQDAATMKRLGRLWFTNAVRNVLADTRPFRRTEHARLSGSASSQRPKTDRPSGTTRAAAIRATVRQLSAAVKNKTVTVTAAGPSLEMALSEGLSGPVVATDTSLAALVAFGVQPEAVVTIDAQRHSVYHIIPEILHKTILIADVSAHPTVVRQAPSVLLTGGGHPLVQELRHYGFPILPLDTAGRNVTASAIEAAYRLGAARVQVVGADYGYPNLKGYARGTYWYSYADRHQTRLQPGESILTAAVLRQPGIERGTDPTWFSTPLLRAYRVAQRETIGRQYDLWQDLVPEKTWDAVHWISTHRNALAALISARERTVTRKLSSVPEIISRLDYPGRSHLPLAAVFRSGSTAADELLYAAWEYAWGFLQRVFDRYST